MPPLRSEPKGPYIRHLCTLAGAIGTRDRYVAMLLDTINFTWFVENDENRASDGIFLRTGFSVDENKPCSVLEMLIGVAARMEFILSDRGKDLSHYYQLLIDNLGINETDQNYEIEDIVSSFLDRRYSNNGRGGLFPLRRPFNNQKNVEIWYQMMAYIEENY